MRLTKQTNYAVRAAIYCALNEPNLSRVADIAKAYEISEMFLFKIILPVVKGGILETVRGRRGGVRLAKPAEEIRLLDIILLTEESFALSEDFEKDGATGQVRPDCGYTVALRQALEAFFEVLGQYTIADLAQNQTRLQELIQASAAESSSPRLWPRRV